MILIWHQGNSIIQDLQPEHEQHNLLDYPVNRLEEQKSTKQTDGIFRRENAMHVPKQNASSQRSTSLRTVL